MAFITDYTLINNAASEGDWTSSGFDSPTLNDTNSTTPIYIEGSACMWFPLKKGQTDGYTYEATANQNMEGRLLVALLNYPFADISNIPITSFALEASSGTFESNNYAEWDALAQLYAPYNTPISGHTPIMGYPDAATETGTPDYSSMDEFGWVATTGNDNDGKQGGFDYFFMIGWVGEHSETFTETFFDDIYEEAYDNDGDGLPDTTSRPLMVVSRSGDFFQFNVRIQFADGAADNANLVVTETGKTIFFSNLHVNHQLGYVFVDPNGANEIRLTLTDCNHFWTDQNSTAQIFTDPENATYFKLDGCSFSNGGIFESPPDSANRWIRGCKFNSCQTGVISDGEVTDTIISNCYAVTVSGDGDLAGSSVLTPLVATDTSGLVWNGAFDPDGQLDGMVFSKGTNAHHAIEFGTATPTTMTLRNIDFSDFTNTIGNNAAPLHIKRTTGTVTINLIGCSGITADGYKTAGAAVVLVVSPVTISVNVKDSAGGDLQNTRVFIETAATIALGEAYQAAVTSLTSTTGTATCTTTAAHGLETGDQIVMRKAQPDEYNKVATVTVSSPTVFTYSVPSGISSPATGTPVVSYVPIHGLTDVNGDISVSRTWAAAQELKGWARLKPVSSPFYKDADIAFTVDTTNGNTINAVLQPDY